jgi:hypothetical protein
MFNTYVESWFNSSAIFEFVFDGILTIEYLRWFHYQC